MGQFLDYLASVFTNKLEPNKDHESSNHVSENSFTRAFTKSDSERSAKLACLGQSNRKTMYLYESIASLAFLANLSMVVIPKLQSEAFKYLEPEGWQLATLTLVPLAIYIASISAMNEINKPILEGSKLTDKNSGLDLNKNDFVHSLKVVILLMAMCQLSSILSDQLLWSTIVIVPIWCYQLTIKVAQSEYQRFAPSPRKQWVKLNLPKSPRGATPSKSAATKRDDTQTRATPRTRTRKAVKNILTGVTDKYHAFEQNVAHQLSQKIFNPLSPKLKMIE